MFVSMLEPTSACARVFHLEAGSTARTIIGTVTCALWPRRCDSIVAQAFVGYAFGFVSTHLPTTIATGHLASIVVVLGVRNTAR